jgi:Zn finger protein HypA/HybF involved in hydrogenase expression
MFTKKELRMAYALAVCLLVVGVASYAAFTPEAPEEPLRLMFKVTAGKVLFDHKTHTSEFGYGLSCIDCHHELEDEEGEDAQPCGECHDPDEGDEEVPKRGDAFHQQCAGCHEEYEAGPIESECAKCHVL